MKLPERHSSCLNTMRNTFRFFSIHLSTCILVIALCLLHCRPGYDVKLHPHRLNFAISLLTLIAILCLCKTSIKQLNNVPTAHTSSAVVCVYIHNDPSLRRPVIVRLTVWISIPTLFESAWMLLEGRGLEHGYISNNFFRVLKMAYPPGNIAYRWL